jgi:hypothetical protein
MLSKVVLTEDASGNIRRFSGENFHMWELHESSISWKGVDGHGRWHNLKASVIRCNRSCCMGQEGKSSSSSLCQAVEEKILKYIMSHKTSKVICDKLKEVHDQLLHESIYHKEQQSHESIHHI